MRRRKIWQSMWPAVVLWWCCLVTPVTTAAQQLIVSPNNVDLGTFYLPPGQGAGPFSFQVSLAGGPKPAPGSQISVSVSTNQPWLTVSPPFALPGSFTASVTILESMLQDEYRGTITVQAQGMIQVSYDNETRQEVWTDSAEINVQFSLKRVILDLLTVAPSVLDLEFTTNDLSPRTFPLIIANANPGRTQFDWSVETPFPWLTVAPRFGAGNTTAVLTVDPSQMPIPADGAVTEGKVIFRSNLNADPVTVTVRVRLLPSSLERLSVFPAALYWSVERAEGGGMENLTPQTLFVLSQNAGWSVWTDAPFVNLESLDLPGSLVGAGMGTRLSVTPNSAVLQSYGYGRHEGRIYVTNLTGDAQRVVPVTVEIRRPGEPLQPPPVPTVLQSQPGYVFVETVETTWFEMLLTAPKTVTRYTSAESCRAGGGWWHDPDGMPGSLDETCSLDEKVYVLASAPEALPGRLYALSTLRSTGITEIVVNGVKNPEADDCYYAAGPVPYIPIGPLQLLGLYGRVVVSVRVGTSLDAAREVQRIQIHVRTPEGTWLVTESYGGAVYNYGPNRPLRLWRRAGELEYEGSWDGVSVTCRPGDGVHQLYILEFQAKGYQYLYEIQTLTAERMTGRWTFSYHGQSSQQERFEASLVAFSQ